MIKDLELKLSGLEPVTREELIELITSHGRKSYICLKDSFGNDLEIKKCDKEECYPLENLDVSEIEDMTDIFYFSYYNGDLSKWDVSNCKDMYAMFKNSDFNNDSLNNWDVSKVETMEYAFSRTKFNGDLSNWNVSNCQNFKSIFSFSEFNNDSLKDWNISNAKTLRFMFYGAKFDNILSNYNFNFNCNDIIIEDMFLDNYDFFNKYNNGRQLPEDNKDIIQWFKDNREKIREINTSKEEVLDFFNFNNEKELNYD